MRKKREALLTAVKLAFGGAVSAHGDASGLHMALRFPGMEFSREFIRRCEDKGIRIAPVSQYCALHSEYCDYLLIGYGHLHAEQIKQGILVLAEVLNDSCKENNKRIDLT